jgi:uncharacterized protein
MATAMPATAPARSSRSFHVMAKPSGSTCNLDCKYCFYLSKETLPGGPGSGQMSDETLALFIKTYIEGASGPHVVFSWQGGEPTLRGIDFFRRAVALQKQLARPGLEIVNDLQTNGVLLDSEWASFLRENRFLVGLSIDGPRELHDTFRVNKGGAPTFDKVMAAATLLRGHGVPFNTLTCVHAANAARPLDVYRFLRRELAATYMQFIPIVEPTDFESRAPQDRDQGQLPALGSPEARPGHPNSVVTEWSVDPDQYGYFLSRVFDEWVRKDLGRVMVSQFETLVAQHMGLPSQMCIYSRNCGTNVAIEHDGGVYACDHYVYPAYRLGNVRETALKDMVFSRQQTTFGSAKSDTLPRYCRECPFKTDCWGECPRNRLIRAPDGEPGLNYLCSGLRRFFIHALPTVVRIVSEMRRSAGRQS